MAESYIVKGMSCAACSARVERAVSAVSGVTSCTVSLLTNSMNVEGDADPADVVSAVKAAGYRAKRLKAKENSAAGSSASADERLAALSDEQTPVLLRRLIVSFIFLLPLLYLSMGHMMLHAPLPDLLSDNPLSMAVLSLLLTAVICVIHQQFFVSGVSALLHGAPNMDTLISLGAASSFLYSTAILFSMTEDAVLGEEEALMAGLHELYFESAAMILTFVSVGKLLESYAKGRTTDALSSLLRLRPQQARLQRDGEEVVVPIEEVAVGDRFLVRPGENIPVDGVVIEGNGAVDESALTGESIPAEKEPGSTVSAATINRSGFLCCEATRIGEDTTFSEIIRMVSDASASKAPIERTADKIASVFVPVVMGIAIITVLIWLLAGQTFSFSLARGICVLVISCPCALGLATPTAVMVASGMGARFGILFKNASALEMSGRIRIVALDKTKTITKGEPNVTDILPADGVSEEELLTLAASLEDLSEHPLAGAVCGCAKERGISLLAVKDFSAQPGNGLSGVIGGRRFCGGSEAYLRKMQIKIAPCLSEAAKGWEKEGKTPLYFSAGNEAIGVMAAADVIREDSAKAIRQLHEMGIDTVMLTGDRRQTAEAIGRAAGVDEIIAEVLPDQKEEEIRRLMKKGRVAMVGDGINDAPALVSADLGAAIGAGTDVAVDAADVVLVKNSLLDLSAALRLGRAALRDIRQNLFWALFYNALGIPLAAGAFYAAAGISLSPMAAAAAMCLSSIFVTGNALRLNFRRIYDTPKKNKKENDTRVKRS